MYLNFTFEEEIRCSIYNQINIKIGDRKLCQISLSLKEKAIQSDKLQIMVRRC